jgi:DNA repair protein RadC
MNLTQALTLCDTYSPTSSQICDRCSRPVAFLFNWDMVQSLCMACFIEALYEHNPTFSLYLKHADTKQQLRQLLNAYQFQDKYLPCALDNQDPLLFFYPDQILPSYQDKGEPSMPAIQQSFIRCDPVQPAPKPIMVRELPPSERPVNRLLKYGQGSVSNAELIAAILQTPHALYQANTFLAKHKGLIGLARASLHELQELEGIGPAQAARLRAAMELGRRILFASPNDRPQVKSPADAANLMMVEMSTLEQEHMRLILLDGKNYVLDTPTMYVGSLNTSVIRVGELFREAIKQNCAAIIVVHNHPSGDPTPSPEDVAVTELITQAGQLLDIDVLDHLIIGQQRYVSLKERGVRIQIIECSSDHRRKLPCTPTKILSSSFPNRPPPTGTARN